MSKIASILQISTFTPITSMAITREIKAIPAKRIWEKQYRAVAIDDAAAFLFLTI